MKIRRQALVFLVVAMVLVLAACAPGSGNFADPEPPANFFHGVWHGWIAPVTLIWQIFDPEIRVYEVQNSGWWYDLGFYMAVISGFGGLAFRRKTPKKEKR